MDAVLRTSAHRRWCESASAVLLGILVLVSSIPVQSGCGSDEGRDTGWWTLEFRPNALRLSNRLLSFDLLVHGNASQIRLVGPTGEASLPPESWTRSDAEPFDFPAADEVRAVLLGGEEPRTGTLRSVGSWKVLRAPDYFALKHANQPFLVASEALSSGWLVSVDADRVGFIYPVDLAEHLRDE